MLFALVLRKNIQYRQSENRAETLIHCKPSITCTSLNSIAIGKDMVFVVVPPPTLLPSSFPRLQTDKNLENKQLMQVTI